ncbi:MAG: hypothetical protein JWR75_374 [Devosia sp.]|nr:hypothetical protein [Devosia sp.]
MATILSLSSARKAKSKAAEEVTAVENRTKFGRTKAEKLRDATVLEKVKAQIDAHKREDS